MRIAYSSESLPPLIDGVTRTLTEVVATLREAGHDFLFLSGVTPAVGSSWYGHVHTVPSIPFPLYPCYRLCLPVARTLDRVLDRFAPDLVHVVTPSLLGLYSLGYARRRALPVLASFHTDFVTLSSYYGLGSLEPLGHYLARAHLVEVPEPQSGSGTPPLPVCSDPADQKFVAVADVVGPKP